MSNLNLKIADKGQISEIKKLYKKAFPIRERKPFFLITKKQNQGSMEILSLNDEGFVGLGITMMNKDLVLLDYFAIDVDIRGKGYGKDALRLLKNRYEGKRLFLEIEELDKSASNNEERVRRKNFYLRNGLSETGIKVDLFGVNMELLSYDCELTFDEYYDLYKNNMGNFLIRKNVKQLIK